MCMTQVFLSLEVHMEFKGNEIVYFLIQCTFYEFINYLYFTINI
jgi:hypothetical protein